MFDSTQKFVIEIAKNDNNIEEVNLFRGGMRLCSTDYFFRFGDHNAISYVLDLLDPDHCNMTSSYILQWYDTLLCDYSSQYRKKHNIN